MVTQAGNRLPDSLLIALSRADRRSVMSLLPERKVTSQHYHSRMAKRVRQRDQQRRLTVGTCAVRQDKGIALGCLGYMQKPSHRRVCMTQVFKRLK